MGDNSVKIDGIEIYMHDIYYYADQYIKTELEIEKVDQENKHIVTENFTDMIFYISDNIEKPSNDNIKLLDDIFNIYKRLCVKYRVCPSLEGFSFLVKINRSTFTDWSNGEYRKSSAHGNTVKKWFNDCKSLFLDNLQNSRGTDANKIFIAKAAYGMAETAPVKIDNANEIPQMSREEIAARYRAQEEFLEKPAPPPDLD